MEGDSKKLVDFLRSVELGFPAETHAVGTQ